MKIGIDISQIVHGTGVSFYTRNLVSGLAKVDRKNDYLLVGTSLRQRAVLEDFAQEIKKKNSHFDSHFFSWPISLAEAWGNRWRWGSLEEVIGSIDVFHSSDWIQPPITAKKVTTIHDFGFWRYPHTAHPKILAVMNRRLELIKKEVDRLIAVSQATAGDILDYLKIPSEKIEVVYEAPGKEFRKKATSEVEKTKEKYRISGKYLLAVATIEPRKNLTNLLEAFYQFLSKNPDFSLVMVGKLGWDKLAPVLSRKIPRVILTGYVPTNDLVALYSGAYGLLLPSFYEGFGLPILEAFACGCPVVTSNVSSMPEVAGRSAVLVNPLKVESIVAGLEVLKNKREELIKRGLVRVKKFSWEKAGRETLAVYEKVNKSKK